MKTIYGKLILPGSNEVVGTGWLPPKPDLRDYTADHHEIKPISKKTRIRNSKAEIFIIRNSWGTEWGYNSS